MPDRFELLGRIGKGGMGTVWKARDRETGQIVAVKMLHAVYADEPDYIARFEREVEIAQRVDSSHVVKVFGYGQQDGLPYMAMEHVEGQSLRQLIKERGKLTWDEAKPILLQVVEGLDAAHRAGVIHRDVKPSNILIAKDGSAKLADFGIARALDMTALTGSSTMLGTPHYMAPEDEVTTKSDLYALGCVAYEMLTGRPPFVGETPRQVLSSHQRGRADLGALPAAARDLVGALLEKDPSRRPTGAAASWSALAGTALGPRGAHFRQQASARLEPGIAARRRVRLAGVAAGAFVAVAVAGVAMASSRISGGTRPQPTPTAGAPAGTPGSAVASATSTLAVHVDPLSKPISVRCQERAVLGEPVKCTVGWTGGVGVVDAEWRTSTGQSGTAQPTDGLSGTFEVVPRAVGLLSIEVTNCMCDPGNALAEVVVSPGTPTPSAPRSPLGATPSATPRVLTTPSPTALPSTPTPSPTVTPTRTPTPAPTPDPAWSLSWYCIDNGFPKGWTVTVRYSAPDKGQVFATPARLPGTSVISYAVSPRADNFGWTAESGRGSATTIRFADGTGVTKQQVSIPAGACVNGVRQP